MKKSFVPPIKINKKPAKTFTWSDGCPMSNGSINPIYRIARNHYQDLYELYKKLYQIGYVCTDQTALIQVHRYPASCLVFKNFNFHIFHPTFWWFTCDDINSKSIVVNYKYCWQKTNESLTHALKILKHFSKKFDNYGRKINMKDKLSQAIHNAKKAERAAKEAEELVKQYKRKEDNKYLVLVAYDNLWDSYEGGNSCDFLIVGKHPANEVECIKRTYSLDLVTANDIMNCPMYTNNDAYEKCVQQFFLNHKEATAVAKLVAKNSFNNNHPTLMTKSQFIDTYEKRGFSK